MNHLPDDLHEQIWHMVDQLYLITRASSLSACEDCQIIYPAVINNFVCVANTLDKRDMVYISGANYMMIYCDGLGADRDVVMIGGTTIMLYKDINLVVVNEREKMGSVLIAVALFSRVKHLLLSMLRYQKL